MNPKAKGRKGRSSETASEDTLGKILTGLGIWNTHIQNSYGTDGLPDRYLGRGYWIECKAMVFSRQVKTNKDLETLLRTSQKRTIPKLIANGDIVHVAIFVHAESEPTRFAMVDYRRFLNMNELYLDKIAVPWGIHRHETLEVIVNALHRAGFPVPKRGMVAPPEGEILRQQHEGN